MKIIGLACGRRMGNSELLLRAALAEATACVGAEAELIRLQELRISDCIGCESCMRGLTAGGDGECVLRGDDFRWLADRLAAADAIILAAPIYNLIPSGSAITLLNRSLGIGKAYQRTCRAAPKIAAAIGQGGSDWINLAEPLLDLTVTNLSKGAVVVDRMVRGGATAPGMVVLDEATVDRARLLGRRVAGALADRGEAVYRGEPGVCPACHGRLLELLDGGAVRCPYCGAGGALAAGADGTKVRWDMESAAKNRFSPEGEAAHRAEIGKSHRRAAENRDEIRRRAAALEHFGGVVVSPPRKETEGRTQ